MRNLIVITSLLVALPSLGDPVRPSRFFGVEYLRIDAALAPSGSATIFRDAADGKLKVKYLSSVYEIGPGYAQRFPSSVYSSQGAEVRFQAGIGGGTSFVQVDPDDGQTPPWSMHFGVAPNDPGFKNDSQVGFGWNCSGSPGYDATKPSMCTNMENWCAPGTGCPDWKIQLERYDTFNPGNGVRGGRGFRYTTAEGRVGDGHLTYAIRADDIMIGVGHTIAETSGPSIEVVGDADNLTDGAVIAQSAGGAHQLTLNNNNVEILADAKRLQVGALSPPLPPTVNTGDPNFFAGVLRAESPILCYDGVDADCQMGHVDQSGHPSFTQAWNLGVFKRIEWVGGTSAERIATRCSGARIAGDGGEGTLFFQQSTAGVRSKTYQCQVADDGTAGWVLVADGGAHFAMLPNQLRDRALARAERKREASAALTALRAARDLVEWARVGSRLAARGVRLRALSPN